MDPITLIFALVPGIILFVYGIQHFSKELQRVASESLRDRLEKITANPLYGAFVGALLTSVIQSSSATALITIGLVNEGMISFSGSLGILIGATVGAALTAQLISFNVIAIAPLFIIAGFFINLFGNKYKMIGKPIFYFGLVLYGLNVLHISLLQVQTDPLVLESMISLKNPVIGLLVATLLTALVQSSSVMIGIGVLLADTGLLSLAQSVPLLLGAGLGAAATAYFASRSMGLYARRAAAANSLFAIVSVVLGFILIGPFTRLVELADYSKGSLVAHAHTLFLIILALLFILTIKLFERIASMIIQGTEDELILRPRFLKATMPLELGSCFDLVEKEIHYAMQITHKLFDQSARTLRNPTEKEMLQVHKLEQYTDILNAKIEDALLDISRRKLSKIDAEKTVLLVRISNAVEQLSDLAEDLGTLPNHYISKKITDTSFDMLHDVYLSYRYALTSLVGSFPHISRDAQHYLLENVDAGLKKITTDFSKHVRHLQTSEAVTSIFVETASLLESSLLKLEEIIKLSHEYDVLRK